MPTTETTRDNPTTAAVNEANRLVSESSRRAFQNSKAAVDAARGWFDVAADLNGKLIDTWIASTETALKASFDVYNASLSAGFPVIDAATGSARTVLQQWDASARQSQAALLDAFRTQAQATGRFVRSDGGTR